MNSQENFFCSLFFFDLEWLEANKFFYSRRKQEKTKIIYILYTQGDWSKSKNKWTEKCFGEYFLGVQSEIVESDLKFYFSKLFYWHTIWNYFGLTYFFFILSVYGFFPLKKKRLLGSSKAIPDHFLTCCFFYWILNENLERKMFQRKTGGMRKWDGAISL